MRTRILLLAGLLLSPLARADRFVDVKSLIHDAMYYDNVPSIVVAVAQGDSVLWAEGFGVADVANAVTATPDTMYSIASVTKPITATALMVLVEAGHIRLDNPIEDYLGGLKLRANIGNARDATVRMVANHTSGLPFHYQFFYSDEGRARPPMSESIGMHGQLMFAPGEKFMYSNLGFGVIEYAIERVAGIPYGQFLQEEVFAPLQMKRTALGDRLRPDDRPAKRYSRSGSELPFYDFSHRGGSAVFSSAQDLLRFAMFHLGTGSQGATEIIGRRSVLSMQEPTARDGDQGYGIGWWVGERYGLAVVEHSGGMPGVSARIALFPEKKIAIVILGNAESGMLGTIEKAIVHTLLPDTIAKGRDFVPASLLLGDWKGEIRGSQGTEPLVVRFEPSGRTYIQLAGQQEREVEFVHGVDGTVSIEGLPICPATLPLGRQPCEMQIILNLRGDRLSGQATTIARPVNHRYGDAISYWVELERGARAH